MSTSKHASGAKWEQVVQVYLKDAGWQILDTNYRSPFGELDIVALEPTTSDPVIVFVEVRSRRGSLYGAPIESITAKKRARILATAYQWLSEHAEGTEEPAIRFDVAAVTVDCDGKAEITLYRGAFDATGV
ncbi:YraN family protein [Chthonomonas calidirosea]|uniref:YraN family protein n=1 Tax=Chthonomonas calidirosea TaxID=454171 RepID=UPI0006EC71B4|nr:YraN family protein [Chthonomonas calidirosea]CEK16153.1 TIGR00252 family protein [Chthonomonas calidirosea]